MLNSILGSKAVTPKPWCVETSYKRPKPGPSLVTGFAARADWEIHEGT